MTGPALDPHTFCDALLSAGVAHFSGVPCSILDPIVTALETRHGDAYVPASVEGEGVAMAAGTWLGGSLSAVFLQNSGLGNTINPIASLAIPYGIPMILVVSWRGQPGKNDAVHHHPMGSATPGLFDLFGVPMEALTPTSDLDAVVTRAVAAATSGQCPAAIVVPAGLFPKSAARAIDRPTRPSSSVSPRHFPGTTRPSRAEATARVLEAVGRVALVSTTGYASREVAARGEAHHFPMQGSMGFALAIGLGLTRARPTTRVVVLDGDGAAIMRLGSFATAGHLGPRRLAHFVFDNASYASTGGQASVSPSVDFAQVALACGYRHAATCSGLEGLGEALDFVESVKDDGPALLRVMISSRESTPRERPEEAPPVIARRFREALSGI